MKYLVLIALLFTAPAFANGNNNNNDGCQGNCPQGGGGDSSATSTAVGVGVGIGKGGDANQAQIQNQKQGQGQSQGQSNSAVGSGNSVNINADAPAIAPSMFGGVSHSTCYANVGGSAGWVGAAFGLNLWKEDHQCTFRQNAQEMRGVWSQDVVRAYQKTYFRGLDDVVDALRAGEEPVAYAAKEEPKPIAKRDRFNPHGL